MSRNHERMRVLHDAHSLAIAVYRHSQDFPRDEWFGLRSQVRRAAVSIACNIVEGSARETTRDYLRFLNIALGSSSELNYLMSLVQEPPSMWKRVSSFLQAAMASASACCPLPVNRFHSFACWDGCIGL